MTDETLTPAIREEIEKALVRRKLEFYQPYAKQRAFHRTGAMAIADQRVLTATQQAAHTLEPLMRERLLIAGNQLGKTMSAGAETAMHVTGLYPHWWEGRVFPQAPSCWVSGPTSQMTRDNPQKMLLGEPGEWGTGMIPGRLILDIKKAVHGVPDAVESVLVKHEPTGKTARILFKTYDQGRIRWQGSTIDFIWCDEEPPDDIYGEAKVRIQVKKGFIMLTFTPLLGMSAVVTRLYKTKPEGSIYIQMGIADAEHYSKEERALVIAGYQEHEREARANGDPVMGSGRVFPVDIKLLLETPIMIPEHWARIGGLDLGWDHPTAAVWGALDADTDTLHIYDAYRMREQTPVFHASAIKKRGQWIPIMWPHDAHKHDPGSGAVIASQFREEGVNMWPTHATHPANPDKLGRPGKEGTGGFGLEAGVMMMLDRMQTGRFKVANTLAEWIEEYRMYYRKDGLIVKEGDDLMSATRMLCMMLRHAKRRIETGKAPRLPGFTPTDRTMGVLG